MTLYIAMEQVPYEGSTLKGVFTTLEAAKQAAVSNKKADFHVGEVYVVDVNSSLLNYADRNHALVWSENKEHKKVTKV